MSLACETCRTQARSALRAAMRSGASRAVAAAPKNFLPRGRTHAPTMAATQTRQFSNTSSRSLLKGLGSSMAEPYRVLGATELLFKSANKAADYHITEEERKEGKVILAEDGEEIGHSLNPDSVWHSKFGLPPSFSTWSHVTMLHLYLINARVRCLDSDAFHNWQHQLTDHFFFECEKKMHIDHQITSSALRQRYLKDIFVQWRGLILAYDEGLVKGDAILASAVWRNLFKGGPDVDPRTLVAIVGWMRSTLVRLEAIPDEKLATQVLQVLEKSEAMFGQRPALLEQQDTVEVPEEKPAVRAQKGGAEKAAGRAAKVSAATA